jgi:hypothetical protein
VTGRPSPGRTVAPRGPAFSAGCDAMRFLISLAIVMNASKQGLYRLRFLPLNLSTSEVSCGVTRPRCSSTRSPRWFQVA